MKKKENDFYELRKRIIRLAYNLPKGKEFTFNDLNSAAHFICSTAIQQDVGRWFAYFVKHTPRVPFEIIGYNGTSLLYRKNASN
ncbi:cassette chromosome ssDNA-binding protein [Staphylococcus simiae]|uniref:Uncharacterized protein n=1 Tax=Staphylococcus simiae CCM 7213 = CCUG 51256 TaxID=911238 RepID=G5JK77_9STAP|nr:DUF1413 domain-containing protein [Staphylococcus simiae]EHJ07407.1 hypothetical protein SS7213T_09444 [Staphylococcus simiae CCM 7213 = CCUG 51256]PNZ09486.1 DUF1413 domain-containing protein [Staphylococcus simiae]SNV54624.1 Domain of uncharacterised function (DUF1413) [Staphylococcus simiae]